MYSPVRITGGPSSADQRGRIAQQFVQSIQKFLRQSEALVPGAASLDLPAHESVPARLDPREAPAGTRCTSAMVSPISARTRSLSASGKARPRLRTQHTRQPRDDEIRPSVALAFERRFRGSRSRSRPRSCASVPRSETNWPRRNGGKIFRMSFSSRARTRLVPVAKTCGVAHARPWPRTISSATGSHCAGSARKGGRSRSQ